MYPPVVGMTDKAVVAKQRSNLSLWHGHGRYSDSKIKRQID